MTSTQPHLPPAVAGLLDDLRRRIRRYVWRHGLAVAVVWLGVAFWLTLGIDWFFEPPAYVRAGILGATMAVLVGIIVEMIVRRLWVPLGDSSMAMLLERRFTEFQESLLTAVELTGRPSEPAECSPVMLARTCRLAAEPVKTIEPARIFNPVPLRQAALAAALLAASVGLYAVRAPGMVALWAERNVLLSDKLWPRNTRLIVEGFPDGATKVAKGSDVEVIAKADLGWPSVPQVVEIRYRSEGGGRDRRTMSREGSADPDKDRFQEYSYTFRSVLVPIEFDVVGGDDAVRGLRIEVVDNPTIVGMELDCRYPDYMARPPQTLPVTAPVMPIPAGTRVTIRARTNKDLLGVDVQSPMDGSARPALLLEPLEPPYSPIIPGKLYIVKNRMVLRPDEKPGVQGAFQYSLDKLTDDRTLWFTLLDTDGIKSREPIRLTLARLDDKPPELAVQLRGVGQAITPRAMLPASGKVVDDYGIARAWFEYVIDQGKPAESLILAPEENPTELPIKHVFDVRDLKLTPGRKLLVMLRASDRCDLAGRPNVGSSQRWLLDVVTPEQLRAMLQQRELSLRQRFAAIIQEVSENRDSLARVQFVAELPKRAEPKGAEPGEKPDAAGPTAAQLAEERSRRVQRAAQYSHKNAGETLGVAEGFGDIREELINNRIDTEELKLRLKEGIADPLRRIAGEMFPELDRRLERLLKGIDDAQAGPECRAQAIQQTDAILASMRQVLDRMVELEDFNEMVEKLRSIIQEHEKLQELIKKRRKEELRRDLLEK